MLCVPTARLVWAQVAWPAVKAIVAQSVVVPSRNVTVPVGVPALEATAAVKVTAWPYSVGLDDDVTVVVDEALFTV